jgi:enamine deaminase RidA (YjgF/YER057c/UK114 family)
MVTDISWDQRAAEAGIEIPPPLPANPLFPGAVVDGSTAYTSGIVAVEGPPWKMAYAGSVGDDLDVEDAQKSAALAMRCTLANLKGVLGGSLDRVDRFLKIMGFVRCRPEFGDAPLVVNGASEVLAAIFGADRLPARSAIGVAALPNGASVEIDAVVRLRE